MEVILASGFGVYRLWALGFWYFASEIQVFMVFPAPGSNDNPFQAF
jgi:hypothetical protein